MKKKLLILATGNIYERRGFFNAVISRTKHLKKICKYDIDVLMLATYEPWLVRTLRNTPKRCCPKHVEIDGISIKLDWFRFSLIDYLLSVKLHREVIFKRIHNSRIVNSLKDYDFIIAHSKECGLIAKKAKELYHIPYSVTWHGSDIHTDPFNNPSSFLATKSIIEDANINYFVSKALMNMAEQITLKGRKQVLYNGYNTSFYRYSDEKRIRLRQKFHVLDKKVVVFAGNFFLVKNILTIPLIFKAIYTKFKNVEFWMIGDGKFRPQVEEMIKDIPVRLWGSQEPETMPDYFNAADVLILPSINEGLPLTIIEGLVCGCNVVGSNVGGIPEVIGNEYCINLDDFQFVEKFAEKVISLINSEHQIHQPLSADFNWQASAIKENTALLAIIENK